MQGTQLIYHLLVPVITCSTARDKLVIEPALPRSALIHHPGVAINWSSLNSHPALVSSSPAYPHGTVAQGLEWSSAEDVSLPAGGDARPVDSSSTGFLRAFIDDLRTDRERVESSASFENNHGSAIELDYSSNTPTSAHRLCRSTASKAWISIQYGRVLHVFQRS